MNSAFDIDRYMERISYSGSRKPTLAVLRALTLAHAQSVPFENISVLQGQPIRLEPESLYEKIVVSHRGGYCFELNGLFLELLTRIGFAVCPLGARVRLGAPDRKVLPRRTHMLLEVTTNSQRWITDAPTWPPWHDSRHGARGHAQRWRPGSSHRHHAPQAPTGRRRRQVRPSE